MTDAQLLLFAFSAGLSMSVFSPILLNWLGLREKRKEKQEDYRRQDAVAAKAERVAKAAADVAVGQHDQLDAIHALVNSEKTEALQAQLNQTRISLALLRRLEGHGEAVGDHDAIEAAQSDIKRLETVLAERGTNIIKSRAIER